MTDLKTDRFTRRALLRAAAGAAGALALGLPARAAAKKDVPLALAFWDGVRLLDPALMREDAAALGGSARITLHSHPAGGPPALHALTVFFPVADGMRTCWTPFTAWAASPGAGGRGSAFILPVHPAAGLRLCVEHGAGRREDFRLGGPAGGLMGGLALRAGTYLFAPAGTDWTGSSLRDSALLTAPGGGSVGFDHLVLVVAPA